MHGLVALDEHDRVLRPAILWNDQRTAASAPRSSRRSGLERLIALTGNRALPGFTAPKLLWLRAPRARRRTRGSRGSRCPRTTSACGYAASTPPTSRTRRGRCCSTSPRRRWSDEVLEALELDRRLAAARCSRARRCPARPRRRRAGRRRARATRPRARSASASTGPGPVSVVLGTSGVVFAALDEFAADPQARVHAFCHAVPGAWHAMGVMLSAAGSLRWLRDVAGPGRRLRRAARPRRRALGARASRGCCSCPTSPASARRTPTPTRAARSRA